MSLQSSQMLPKLPRQVKGVAGEEVTMWRQKQLLGLIRRGLGLVNFACSASFASSAAAATPFDARMSMICRVEFKEISKKNMSLDSLLDFSTLLDFEIFVVLIHYNTVVLLKKLKIIITN